MEPEEKVRTAHRTLHSQRFLAHIEYNLAGKATILAGHPETVLPLPRPHHFILALQFNVNKFPICRFAQQVNPQTARFLQVHIQPAE